ncbi:MAG: Na+/H+ antiporter NhaC [Flavobacteriales bacterium]|nr:Na+/H+ antiporter NhaC [Flavobacteriales bacterium]MCB0409744.1 Na+/H+ antiporter NhaC [Flavobacteriales bacterium]MCB9174418.1 Na+/H+ antiporter NhaC [Flavobacteriales bacterium]
MSKNRQPSLIQSIIPIIILIGLLAVNVLQVYGDGALDGANQLALLLAATVAGVIGIYNGFDFERIIEGITKSIHSALPAIIILLLIGALAGTWLLSGVVPAMIYYGLDILNPKIFLFATCIICSIVSIATGSSWSTVATVGIALLGIGKALGIGEPIIAGAIISGAYFGDKMSPLSDTTNLAPAMAGTDLITHIKYMTLTTIPSIVITLIIFLIIGFFYEPGNQTGQVDALQLAISSKFNITPWLFLVPLVVIGLILLKIPAIPSLFLGSLLGGFFAIMFQGELIHELFADTSVFKSSYKAVVNSMTTDVAIVTENELVNELLSSGGMKGMLNTIWLILCAMIFGGVMEITGMLKRITKSIIGLAKNDGSLIATTTASCVVFNVTASDQYLAIVVPGKMFAEEYKERNLHPKVLSRTLEDSGTVTSALIPWNTCGAYHSGVLGIATGDYFMYCFFNLISPLMTIVFGFFNIKIAKLNEEKLKE